MTTLTWQDGFDLYGDTTEPANNYSATESNTTFLPSGGRFGGGCLQYQYTLNNLSRLLDPALPYVQAGFAHKFDNGAQNSCLLQFSDSKTYQNGPTTHAGVYVNANNGLTVYGDALTVLGSSADNVVPPGLWKFVEVRLYWHGTAGTLAIHLNGNPDPAVSVSASDLKTVNNVIYMCLSGQGTAASGTPAKYVDDWYIVQDASAFTVPISDKRFITNLPNGDTAQADLLKSSGSVGNTLVNDTGGGDGDAGYLYGNTAGHKSTFTFPALSGSPTIYNMAVKHRGKKTDAGSRTIRAIVKSGAVTGNGLSWSPSTDAYSQQIDHFQTDPNTGVAWTAAGANSANIGVEIVT